MDKLESHLLEDHEGSELGAPIIRRGSVAECRICQEKVVADAWYLERHLDKAHRGVSLEEYFKQHVQAEEVQRRSDPRLNQTCRVLVKRIETRTAKRRKLVDSIKDIPVDFNQCRFQCLCCKRSFETWPDMKNHRKESGCLPCRPGQEGVAVKKVMHTCRLCDREVFCDKELFQKHLGTNHGCGSLPWYRLEIQGRGSEHKPPLNFMLSKKRALIQRAKKAVPLVSPPLPALVMPPKSLPDELVTAKDIYSLCLFKCTNCGLEDNSWARFLNHVKKCLGTKTFSRYSVKKARYHKCSICAMCMLCDETIIIRHYRSKHNMASRGKFLKKCQDKIQKQVQNEKGVNIRNCSIVLQKLSLKVLQEHNALADKETHSPKKTHHLFMDLSSAPRSNVMDDLCEFVCVACGKQFKNFTRLKYHRKRGAPCSKESTTVLCLQTVSKAVSYECSICRKLILCDRRVITNHLRHVHGLERDKYLAKTGEKYFSETPRFRQERERIDELKRTVPVLGNPALVHPDQTTFEVENLCRFRCPDCPFENTSLNAMKEHLRKYHVAGR